MDPEILWINIPDLPEESKFKQHPISRSQKPKMYKVNELKDPGDLGEEWIKFFELYFVGLFWKIGRPVPYLFKTVDGKVRSLDAGCMKFLSNRAPPEIRFEFKAKGLIVAAAPTPSLLSRYVARKGELVDMFLSK
ncbi:hypothetical protein [Methylobrevis pamukkalensis]|uniref:Uncharacterized protein n=1 Tax=Methylobrevis pamukkalensis TaxID=1439726 RepID=A0A1E3GXT8_9HYPH|nr:hypothetical protein [Methylobrevis pamukkalensis]ODN68834.1 hypothetical protein A6302_03865 [Methylobrevis pamukkalensis]